MIKSPDESGDLNLRTFVLRQLLLHTCNCLNLRPPRPLGAAEGFFYARVATKALRHKEEKITDYRGQIAEKQRGILSLIKTKKTLLNYSKAYFL